MLGSNSLGGSSNNSGPSLNVTDAMSLDLKTDDGRADGGDVITTETQSVPGSCTTNGAYWNAWPTSSSDWVTGDETGAKRIWQGAALSDPEHRVLRETLERLGVELPIDTTARPSPEPKP